jgi:hypothetical protein
MNEDEAAAELSRILGEHCAAEVLTEVRAIKGGRIGVRWGRERLTPEERRNMERIAGHADELARALRQWMGDPRSARMLVANLAEWRASNGEDGTFEDVRRDLSAGVALLGDLAQWALFDLDRRRPSGPGPAPDAAKRWALQSMAINLARYGHPLATGENAKLTRVARICWPLMGFTGDARDALRRGIERGTLDLEWPRHLGSALAVAGEGAEGGELTQASAELAPGGETPKRKPKRAP